MTDELKQAFEVLAKYEYEGRFGYWYPITSIERYENTNIRLKPLKPLTVEEAEKLKYVYVPYIRASGASYYTSYENNVNYAKHNIAYATGEEATRAAQQWLDNAKEKAGL